MEASLCSHDWLTHPTGLIFSPRVPQPFAYPSSEQESHTLSNPCSVALGCPGCELLEGEHNVYKDFFKKNNNNELIKKAEGWRIDAFYCGAREDSWETLGLQGDQTNQS